MKKIIGQVTEIEKDQMMCLYEKKLALNELFLSLNSLSESEEIDLTYKKIVKDLVKTNEIFNKFCNDLSMKYRWGSQGYSNWIVDFATNDVYVELN